MEPSRDFQVLKVLNKDLERGVWVLRMKVCPTKP